ncbi:MPN domain-containing protein-like [Rana temporaria]|uniref:MPN domain-containing protein-like n=1 Tax=Rana temporaria TaxID=8407 RepID=UPI001AAD7A08|nr:MPN domain-containing protein-like [Rana temporaria]
MHVAFVYVITIILCIFITLNNFMAVQRCSPFDIRTPVRFSTLGSRDSARDPHTLVQLTSFMAINKFQPFHVSICSNALLLLDFHSHLTQSEVAGYLGGQWDTNSQLLTVLRAFPCRSRLRDTETAAAAEEEVICGESTFLCSWLR